MAESRGHHQGRSAVAVHRSGGGYRRGHPRAWARRGTGHWRWAVNQAIKAAAIARRFLALDGIDVIYILMMVEVVIDDQERTAVKLVVEPR